MGQLVSQLNDGHFKLYGVSLDTPQAAIKWTRIFVLQFMFIKPSMALIEAIVLYYNGSDTKSVIVLRTIGIFSIIIALTVLLLCFYRRLNHHLVGYSIGSKFLWFKLNVFFLIIQDFLFGALIQFNAIHESGQYSATEVADRIRSAVVLSVTFLFMVSAFSVFSTKDQALQRNCSGTSHSGGCAAFSEYLSFCDVFGYLPAASDPFNLSLSAPVQNNTSSTSQKAQPILLH